MRCHVGSGAVNLRAGPGGTVPSAIFFSRHGSTVRRKRKRRGRGLLIFAGPSSPVSRHPARSALGIPETRNLDYGKIPTIKPIYNLLLPSFLPGGKGADRKGKSATRKLWNSRAGNFFGLPQSRSGSRTREGSGRRGEGRGSRRRCFRKFTRQKGERKRDGEKGDESFKLKLLKR